MHNHNHDCKHEVIKYCEECEKVYCEDCGKEWEDKCELNRTNWWDGQPFYEPWRITYTTTTEPCCLTTCSHQEDNG